MHQGQKVRELREERGWGQEDLAERLTSIGRPMTQSNVSHMEKRETLDGGIIADLAKIFAVSPVVFFESPGSYTPEAKAEMIEKAWELVRSDPTWRGGSSGMAKAPLEAKLYLVRTYERNKGRKLLPDDLI